MASRRALWSDVLATAGFNPEDLTITSYSAGVNILRKAGYCTAFRGTIRCRAVCLQWTQVWQREDEDLGDDLLRARGVSVHRLAFAVRPGVCGETTTTQVALRSERVAVALGSTSIDQAPKRHVPAEPQDFQPYVCSRRTFGKSTS